MASNPLLDAANIYNLAIFIGVVGGLFVAFVRWHKGAIDRALSPVLHKVNNSAMRIDSLEKRERDHDSRILKVEAAIEAFEKGQERIEAKLDKLSDRLP